VRNKAIELLNKSYALGGTTFRGWGVSRGEALDGSTRETVVMMKN
jgi:hypothetical protein